MRDKCPHPRSRVIKFFNLKNYIAGPQVVRKTNYLAQKEI